MNYFLFHYYFIFVSVRDVALIIVVEVNTYCELIVQIVLFLITVVFCYYRIYDFHYALKQFKNDAKVRRTSSNDQALENNLKLSIDKFREALNNKLSADQPLYSGNVKTMPVKYFLSQAKLRWAKAIRKVLLRNQVAAIKRQLEDIQLEKELFRKTHKNGITRQRSVDDINVYENTNFNKQSKGKLDKQSNHDGSHLPTLDDDGKHHEKSGGESGRNGSFSLPGMQKGLVDENGRTFHGLFWSNPVNDSEDSLDGNPSDIDCSNHSGSEKHFEKPNSSKIFDNPKSHANHINGLKKGKHGCKYNHIHHDIDDTMNKNEGSLSNMIVYNKSKEALEAIAKGKLYHDIDRAHINMGITNGNATVHHLRHQLDTPAMIAMKVMNSVETKQAEKSDENKKNKRRHTYDEHLPNLLENNKNVPRYAQATSSSLLSDHHKIDTVKNTTKGVKSGNSSNSSSRSSSRTRTRPSLEKRGDSNHLEPINLLGSTGQKDVRESRAASEVKGKPPIGRKRTESISGSELDMSEAFFDVHDHRAQFQTDARLETRQLRLVSKAFLM